MARKPKRLWGPGGLVHGFTDGIGDYGEREARTYCGIPVWEEAAGLDERFQVVRHMPISCLYCIVRRLV